MRRLRLSRTTADAASPILVAGAPAIASVNHWSRYGFGFTGPPPFGCTSKWRWGLVVNASPVFPTKPITSPRWTRPPRSASGVYADRCA